MSLWLGDVSWWKVGRSASMVLSLSLHYPLCRDMFQVKCLSVDVHTSQLIVEVGVGEHQDL